MTSSIVAHIDSMISSLERQLDGFRQARELIVNTNGEMSSHDPEALEKAVKKTKSRRTPSRRRPAAQEPAEEATGKTEAASATKSRAKSTRKSTGKAKVKTTRNSTKATPAKAETRADRIRTRLSAGEEPTAIAAAEGCEPAYVYYVRKRMK